MRAFVTGIGGFVGSYLARDLVRESLEVHGIVERESSHFLFGKELESKVFLYPCDIRDSERLTKILRDVNPDRIFHLAAVGSLPQASLEVERTFQTNFIGTLNLYEAVRKSGANPRILFVGSAQEYGLTFNEIRPINEDCPLRPVDPYSASKASADLLSFQYCFGVGLPIIRVRPFNHTGPGQSEHFVCSSFAKQIAEIESGRKEAIVTVGNLKARRDFLDVRDVIRAYQLALERGKIGEVYNICSEKSISIGEILALLLGLSSKTIRVVRDAARGRDLEIFEMLGDCKKFKNDTGWQSRILLEQTLEDLLNYWRKICRSSSDRVGTIGIKEHN